MTLSKNGEGEGDRPFKKAPGTYESEVYTGFCACTQQVRDAAAVRASVDHRVPAHPGEAAAVRTKRGGRAAQGGDRVARARRAEAEGARGCAGTV